MTDNSKDTAPLTQPEIITSLKGQILHIPDLTTLFGSWPAPSRSPHYSFLKPFVDSTIRRIAAATGQTSLERRLDDDIALLTSLWFPKASSSEDDLKTLAVFAMWLVCWDDEVDANEGDLSGNYEAAQRWREETMKVARTVLDQGTAAGGGDVDALNGLLLVFGESFAKASTEWQKKRLLNEITFFIDSCAQEQALRLDGTTIPSFDRYMAIRLGTVGGSVLCSLVEFSLRSSLPSDILQSAPALVMVEQVGVLLGLLNDVLSLKKELKSGCVINAVATLLTTGESGLDKVVEELWEKMDGAVKSFDDAARDLFGLAGEHTDDVRSATERYIEGCRSIITGTLEFTLVSPRYNISKLRREDGSLQITL